VPRRPPPQELPGFSPCMARRTKARRSCLFRVPLFGWTAAFLRIHSFAASRASEGGRRQAWRRPPARADKRRSVDTPGATVADPSRTGDQDAPNRAPRRGGVQDTGRRSAWTTSETGPERQRAAEARAAARAGLRRRARPAVEDASRVAQEGGERGREPKFRRPGGVRARALAGSVWRVFNVETRLHQPC
jgi:hypothetical protein